MNKIPKELAIYQTSNGEIKLKEDVEYYNLDKV